MKLQFKAVSIKDNSTKDVTLTIEKKTKLTAVIAAWLKTQVSKVTIHYEGKTFDIPGMTATNFGERNFAFIGGLLFVTFAGCENKTVIVSNWITENLATSFKVAGNLSLNGFSVILGNLKGIYRDTVKTQKLQVEIANKPIMLMRSKTQAELKATVLQHQKAFPLLDAPKTETAAA